MNPGLHFLQAVDEQLEQFDEHATHFLVDDKKYPASQVEHELELEH